MSEDQSYDALLLVSFGGPERREDVIPFLENVLRGRNVPRQRMLEVAEHYYHFGGASPINEQNRALLAALKDEFATAGIKLPVYWGNRNWTPLLPDMLRQMKADGVRRTIAFFTSAFSSYSGCRQYLENIAAGRRRSRGWARTAVNRSRRLPHRGQGGPSAVPTWSWSQSASFPTTSKCSTTLMKKQSKRRKLSALISSAPALSERIRASCG